MSETDKVGGVDDDDAYQEDLEVDLENPAPDEQPDDAHKVPPDEGDAGAAKKDSDR